MAPITPEPSVKAKEQIDLSSGMIERVLAKNGLGDKAGSAVVAMINRVLSDPAFELELANSGVALRARNDAYHLPGKSNEFDLVVVDKKAFSQSAAYIIAIAQK